jgi:hypothetical protein
MAGIIFSESAGVADSIYGKSQAPIRAIIETSGEAFEQESALDKIFVTENSTTYAEKFTGMTAMEGFKPVGENGVYPEDSMKEGFSKTFEHVTWKDRFSISREMIDDSKTIDLKQRPKAFVTGYYRTRELFGAALLGGALEGKSSIKFEGREFDVTTADGKNLFNKSHPSKVSGAVQSNIFADQFSNEALAAIEAQMQGFKGDNGNILGVTPGTIVIPNDYKLKLDVFSAIGADKDPNSANNGFNFTFGRWNVIVWSYLNQFITAGSKPWIVMSESYNKDHYGAVWLDRTGLEIKSTVDDNNDANRWQGYSRWSAGFNDWRAFAAGGITGGSTLIGA